jgi:hypothetical protein
LFLLLIFLKSKEGNGIDLTSGITIHNFDRTTSNRQAKQVGTPLLDNISADQDSDQD